MGSRIDALKANLEGPVLITGHTGFKGIWLTLLLEKMDIEVVGYAMPARSGSLYEKLDRQNKIKEHLGDIRNFEQYEKFLNLVKPSVIFHLAAQPLVMESYRDPLETFDVNIMGTANVLDSALKSDFVKLVEVVTSDKVYANTETGDKFSEGDRLWGYDPYSASKVGAEIACSAWRRVIEENDLNLKIVTVRSGNVIGGGDNSPGRLMTDIIEGLLTKKKIKIKNPFSTRPWQHVLDPLFGYILAADHALNLGAGGDSYNFGPKTNSLSVQEVLAIVQTTWPEPTSIEFQNGSQNAESKFLDLNSDKSAKNLDWNPIWTQESAVKTTLNWWENVELHNVSELEACNLDLDYMWSQL
jgi:CDP-glucose 4,6-dehydratase